jgi:hypothetical protein
MTHKEIKEGNTIIAEFMGLGTQFYVLGHPITKVAVSMDETE